MKNFSFKIESLKQDFNINRQVQVARGLFFRTDSYIRQVLQYCNATSLLEDESNVAFLVRNNFVQLVVKNNKTIQVIRYNYIQDFKKALGVEDFTVVGGQVSFNLDEAKAKLIESQVANALQGA